MTEKQLEGAFAPTPIKMLVLLFLTAIVVYWRTLGFEFALDDVTHLVENSGVHSVRGTIRSLLLPTPPGNLYRPLVTLSYGLTYRLFDLNPFPYHLTNVLLNACNVALLFAVLQRVFSLPIAGWTALLFAVLPIHSEAVANVHGRTELLSCFFGFLFLYLLPGKNNPRLSPVFRALALTAILFLAVSSKESAIVFSLLGALLLHREKTLRAGLPSLVVSSCAALLAYIVLRIGVLQQVFVSDSISFIDNPLIRFIWFERAVLSFMLLGKYLWLSTFPWPLSADYSYAQLSPLLAAGPQTYLFAALAAAAFLCLFKVKRSSAFHFFIAWFFLSFFVTSNIFFPVGTIFGERLCYVSSAAIAGIWVFLVERFANVRWREWILGSVTVVYAAVTMTHLPVWRNNESLAWYQHQVAPRSVKSATNLAVILRDDGSYDYAFAEARRAQEILPDYDQASFVEATIYAAKGDTDEARRALLHTLELNPSHLEALRLLAVMDLNAAHPDSGDLDSAEAYFRRMLSISPNNHQAEVGLFAVALKRGRVDVAERMWRQLQASDPHNAELSRLGATLRAMLEQVKKQ